MNPFRIPILALVTASLSGCVLFMGTADAYVIVTGELAPGARSCSIRFASKRSETTRGEQRIDAGAFRVSFLYHYGEKRSDFAAQLSCGGSEWRNVGRPGAFLEGPVDLGTISPQAAG
jgi:hypothetical protein